MIGNVPHDRDELLVTGIPPVTGPLTLPLDEPVREASGAETTTPIEPEAVSVEPEAVFVDASGWRARFGRRLGLAAGAVLVVFLGALGIGMATGPSVPLTPWGEPSARPRVQVGEPGSPSGAPSGQRTGARPGTPPATDGPAPAAPPPAPSAPGTSAVRPPPSATAHPGRSQASPPAWGRKKKKR
ncbi:hypothetical protein [Actinomadura decatromicini]|uniref:hypothetical protein n=1 Tax=Actinomadura decatromicini TaxID=2604572 RepID=UPI001FE4F47F|nr:hypothetical protein [Actinomadura decatromicini]